MSRLYTLVSTPGKFAVVGIANTVLDASLFLLLVYGLEVPPVAANLISYSAGMINSFVLNKNWTFSHTAGQGEPTQQFVLFALLNLVGLAIATALVWWLAEPLGPALAKGVAVGAVFAWNYSTSRFLIFRRRTGPQTP